MLYVVLFVLFKSFSLNYWRKCCIGTEEFCTPGMFIIFSELLIASRGFSGLSIPLMFDQPRNAGMAKLNGLGKVFDKFELHGTNERTFLLLVSSLLNRASAPNIILKNLVFVFIHVRRFLIIRN